MVPRVILLDAPDERRPCHRALVAHGPWYYRCDVGRGKAKVRGISPGSRDALDIKGGPSTLQLLEVVSEAIFSSDVENLEARIEKNASS